MISVISGSRRSGSSGPCPRISSETSWAIFVRSDCDRAVCSASMVSCERAPDLRASSASGRCGSYRRGPRLSMSAWWTRPLTPANGSSDRRVGTATGGRRHGRRGSVTDRGERCRAGRRGSSTPPEEALALGGRLDVLPEARPDVHVRELADGDAHRAPRVVDEDGDPAVDGCRDGERVRDADGDRGLDRRDDVVSRRPTLVSARLSTMIRRPWGCRGCRGCRWRPGGSSRPGCPRWR